MMRHFLLLTLALLTMASIAATAPILTLTPSSGNLTGEPGSVVGWGFHLSPDPDEWITVVSSFLLFESNPDLGFYEDYVGMQGGPNNGALAPGDPDWSQAFDPDQGFGIGAFILSPFATLGDRNEAQLIVLYERFSANPSICSTCNLGSGEFSFDVSITAGTNPIPEPGTFSLALLCLAMAATLRHRRKPQP